MPTRQHGKVYKSTDENIALLMRPAVDKTSLVLDRTQLERYVGTTGRTIEHVELDYLQHITLYGIYVGQKELAQLGVESVPLLFKGGTSLQKVDLTDRFSRDLDFTADEPKHSQIIQTAQNSTQQCAQYGFKSDFDVTVYSGSATVKLRVKGPTWQQDEKQTSIAVVRSEISFREKPQLEPIQPLIIPRYAGIDPYTVTMMNPNEIVAEKIRAIMTRQKVESTVKDLYDLWSLLNKGYVVDDVLVAIKMSTYGERFFNRARFEERVGEQSTVWQDSIHATSFLRSATPPAFSKVREETLELMRK